MNPQVNVPRGSGENRYRAPEMRMGRSQFDLTHQHKTTYEVGYLIPYFMMEIVPGDTVTCELTAFQRIFSPLDAPIMDDIESTIDFWFVPNRLVWDHWEDFLGAHDEHGAQDTNYTIPIVADGDPYSFNELACYMGIPPGADAGVQDINALPFRAYRRIYNDKYRDQNLIDKVANLTTDTATINSHSKVVLKSAKKHDYFTSALPYLQKGPAVTLSLGSSSAPIRFAGAASDGFPVTVRQNTGTSEYRLDSSVADLTPETTPDTGSELYADLSSVTAVNVNSLREAEGIQRLLERDARGGTRYPELIKAHFGVDVPDARIQQPEYLGGGRGFINVSPVANTSATASQAQGSLAGVGTGRLGAKWAKSFVEHGYVIGLLRSRGQLSYQQGLERHWSRSTKLDFLWGDLANLGEQPIYKRELFLEGDATDDEVFGYQERYADYRFKQSLVTGKFNSNAAGSLDFWHLAEDLTVAALNQTFIEDQTPMGRVTTVDSEPDFVIDGRFDVRVARMLPVRPVPSLAPPRF